jgi:hypothetical protein
MRGNIQLFTLSLKLRNPCQSKLSGFEKKEHSLPTPVFMTVGEDFKLKV